MESIEKSKNKLWNKNFFLLWQGQMVSVLGDVIYIIALDFWILDMTGSTALMGLLSAITMLPRIVFGPFVGVFVDRWDSKKIIILTDFIRGIAVTFIGIAALIGFIEVWMVFLVGIVSGICSAFFNPTIMSATNNYYLMLVCVFIAFACNVHANTILSTSMMVIIPQEIRAKVMAIISTMSMGLIPIGQCLGGVLGEILSVRLVMISLLLCFTICVVINVRIKNLRKFIEYDSRIDNLESLVNT